MRIMASGSQFSFTYPQCFLEHAPSLCAGLFPDVCSGTAPYASCPPSATSTLLLPFLGASTARFPAPPLPSRVHSLSLWLPVVIIRSYSCYKSLDTETCPHGRRVSCLFSLTLIFIVFTQIIGLPPILLPVVSVSISAFWYQNCFWSKHKYVHD